MKTTAFGELNQSTSAAKPNKTRDLAAGRPSRLRGAVGGAMRAAVCLITAFCTLAAAPAVLAMSDRQDLVHWLNQILDFVGQ